MADETFKSTDDQRVDNTLRHSYRVLSDVEKEKMAKVKDLGQEMLDFFKKELGESRELSLARTNLEQAVMWAVKHVTR